MQVGILRLHNVYGPFCDLSPERSQVIPSLIRKAIRYPAEEFIVWGSGSQTRAFVFVGDVVRALLLAAEKGMNCGTIQIGMEERVAIADLAGKIVRISGKKIPVKMDTTKPDGDAGRSGNCAKANRILEWQATTGLEQGLTTTYQWIEQQINKQS
jgi:nucleoside-diphosphate-sugar epimerase